MQACAKPLVMTRNGSGKLLWGRAGFINKLGRLKSRTSKKMGASKKMRGLITNNEDLFFLVFANIFCICGHEDLFLVFTDF